MKKLPLMLLTVAMAACITFSFTACDGGNTTDTTDNSSLVSDKLTSLEEWEAVFDGSNYNNFTASATSVCTSTSSYTKTSADGTTESSNSTATVSRGGTAEYDFTKDTYLTGTYGSNIQQTFTSSDSTGYSETSTEMYYNYQFLTETDKSTASKIENNGESADWSTTNNTVESGWYTPYTTDVYWGQILTATTGLSIGGAYLGVDSFYICATYSDFNQVTFINDLFTAEYTGIDVSSNYNDSTTAAEYKDGSYVCRYGAYAIDYDAYQYDSNNPNNVIEQYSDIYVKVNDGHISYIKSVLVFNYHYEYTTEDGSTSVSEIVETQAVEWNFYNFGTTTVTVPDEVTALFE